MKRTLTYIFLGGFSLSVFMTGCSKKADDLINNNTPTTTSAPTPSYNFSDASGVFVALKTVTQTTVAGIVIPTELSTPTAVFPSPLGSSTYVDAGTVSCNSKSLTRLSNNSYIYNDIANPVTYDNVTWSTTGSGSIPAVNYTEDKQMPAFSGYSSLPTTVTRSAGLTVNLSGTISNSDSVYVVLISTTNSKMSLKRVAASGSSVAFSADDLSPLGTGSAYLEVCPWNYKIEDISSKNFYFIMESAYVKTVTIN